MNGRQGSRRDTPSCRNSARSASWFSRYELLPIYLFVNLFIYLYIYLSLYLPVKNCIAASVRSVRTRKNGIKSIVYGEDLPIYISIYLSYLFIYLSIYLYNLLSIFLFRTRCTCLTTMESVRTSGTTMIFLIYYISSVLFLLSALFLILIFFPIPWHLGNCHFILPKISILFPNFCMFFGRPLTQSDHLKKVIDINQHE